MNIRQLIPLLLLLVTLTSVETVAHPGGTDDYGCHTCRTNCASHGLNRGQYHCHSGNGSTGSPQFNRHDKPTRLDVAHGRATVVDADTISIRNTTIRLHGIDAPESNQICRKDGKPWMCGNEAANRLDQLIQNRNITCQILDQDRYGRAIAKCQLGERDISAWLVANGWAVAYRRYSTQYIRQEQSAKAGELGVWGSEFEMPWDFRRRR